MLRITFCLLLTSLLGVVSATVDHLTLHDCMQNTTEEYGRIVSLTLDPYPPRLPGKVTVSATIQLVRPVTGHVRMDLQIVKKLGFLGYALQIPCISHIGTCNYTDVCAMLKGEEPYVPTKPSTTAISTTNGVSTNTNARTVATVDYSEGYSESQATAAETDFTMETSPILASATPSDTSETVVLSWVTKPSPGLEAGSSPDLTEQIPDEVQTTAQSVVASAEADEVDTATDSAAVLIPKGSQTSSQQTDATTIDIETTQESASTKASSGDETATPSATASTETDEATTTESSPAGTPASETVVSIDDVSSTAESVTSVETGSTTEQPCPDIMRQNNIPCTCPFMPGSYTLPPTSFDIPDLGVLSSLARGDYKVRLRFFDMDTGKMLACQQVETTLASPCTDMDCIVG